MAWLKKTSVTWVLRSWAETPLSATVLYDCTRASVNCSAASFILCWLCWSVIRLVTILSVATLRANFVSTLSLGTSWLATWLSNRPARLLPHAFFCRLPLAPGECGLLPLAHSYGALSLQNSPSHALRLRTSLLISHQPLMLDTLGKVA